MRLRQYLPVILFLCILLLWSSVEWDVYMASVNWPVLAAVLYGVSWLLLLAPVTLILCPILVFAAASLRRLPQLKAADAHKATPVHFTVIIPAYNEERVILNSVQSLNAQDYPRHCLQVVVAFNGTDRTGEIAAAAGASVVQTPHPGVGKRNAIVYALDQLQEPETPATYILILDADNLLAPDFLRQMARAAQGGALALQGNHQPLLASANWVSRGLAAAYRASSRLYNQGRSQLCNSALLCGTGFAMRADVLRTLWPRIRTQTEDIELNGLLLRHYHAGVQWVAEACFYDEKPDSLRIAIRQRTRWMVGHFWCALLYTPILLIEGVRLRRWQQVELACYYLFPFALLGSVLTLALALAGLCLTPVLHAALATGQQLWCSLAVLLVYLLYVLLGDWLSAPYSRQSYALPGSLLAACYSLLFALCVWPVAIVRACFMLGREDWIFHTPHKAVQHVARS